MIHTTQTHQIGDNVELMRKMEPETFDTIITSPPYWGLRDYGVDGQIGLEPTLEEYHARMLEVTAECMRVLKPTGVMFWNHGDSYGGSASQGFGGKGGTYAEMAPHGRKRPKIMDKCLIMQNERLIIQMIDDQGWILRNRIIWNKPNGMPSSVTDRFSNKYEPVYMLVKSKKYWFDLDAVRVPHKTSSVDRWHKGGEDTDDTKFDKTSPDTSVGNLRNASNPLHALGKNPGDVWTIPTQPYPERHFATFPTALIEPMIKAACPAEICPVCEMARERITEPTGTQVAGIGKYSKTANHINVSPTSSLRTKQVIEKHTTGWTSCDCDVEWIVGTVLDPFCGSGTVLEVCRLMNRNAIGMEMNPEYETLIKDRSMSHTPPLTAY